MNQTLGNEKCSLELTQSGGLCENFGSVGWAQGDGGSAPLLDGWW